MPSAPKKDETESDYVGRCMSELNDEYSDNKQRAAICYSKFREAHAASEGVSPDGKPGIWLTMHDGQRVFIRDVQRKDIV